MHKSRFAMVADRLAPLLAQTGAPTSVAYFNGPLLQNVSTQAVFLGSAWNSDPAKSVRSQLDDYLSYLVISDVVTNLSEYSTNGMTIGTGAHNGSIVLDQLVVGATIDDSTIQQAVTDAIAGGTLPGPDANTLYIAFPPPRVSVTAPPPAGTSCADSCAYHGVLTNNAAYAVIPYPGCAGCEVNGSDFDGLTCVISHEVCESITNPFDNGWHDANDNEIGDLCAVPTWQTRQSGQYVVQKEWSNAANGCR